MEDDLKAAQKEVENLLAQAAHIDESAPGPYGYERIRDPSTRQGFHYRVYDANDDRIATCYIEGNAKLVVRLMNLGLKTS